MTDNQKTPPPPNVWPTLSYDDALAAIDFLTRAFGFESRGVHTDQNDPTDFVHAELAWPPGGGVTLGSAPRPDGWPDVRGRGSTYCVTDEVDAVFERAVAAGARVLREPTDEDYGGRDFVVLDPEGNQWSFGTYPGEYAAQRLCRVVGSSSRPARGELRQCGEREAAPSSVAVWTAAPHRTWSRVCITLGGRRNTFSS